MPRTHIGFVSLVAGLVLAATAAPLARQPAVVPDDSANPAYRHFNEEIARYLAIHTDLRAEVPGPVPGSSAQQLTAASDMLFNAIRRARPNGRQGDFFDAGADDEVPPMLKPDIYLRFPAENEMASMPPSLLNVLPRLPAELEYRIVGEHLVLRDVKAAMLLDYIPNALPRKK
jgi:hypothetical protein